MLVSYNVSRDDIQAFIEVARSVKDRGLDYVGEYDFLKENGFYSSLLEKFGSLDNAKDYFVSHINQFESERGGMQLVIDFINRLMR